MKKLLNKILIAYYRWSLKDTEADIRALKSTLKSLDSRDVGLCLPLKSEIRMLENQRLIISNTLNTLTKTN